jgi:hypothetical protein
VSNPAAPTTMYSAHVSPIHRMRRSSAHTKGGESQKASFSSATSKRKALLVSSGAPLASPKMNGDYHVLQQGVDQQRETVREARSSLASALDRLGEHHVRQKEYDSAMDAFAEALHEKRSIFSNVLNGSWFDQQFASAKKGVKLSCMIEPSTRSFQLCRIWAMFIPYEASKMKPCVTTRKLQT